MTLSAPVPVARRSVLGLLFLTTALLGMCLSPCEAFVPQTQRTLAAKAAPSSPVVLYNKKKAKKKASSSNASKGFGGAASSSSGSHPLMDRFPYAGVIRPGQQTQQKVVTVDAILKPDYAETGLPSRMDKPMFPWMIEVKTVDEIEKMRAAGSLARDILDLAGRTVQVGVTTDEIDSVVHAEILRVGSTVSR
jgi:methionyl aminopeptidase